MSSRTLGIVLAEASVGVGEDPRAPGREPSGRPFA